MTNKEISDTSRDLRDAIIVEGLDYKDPTEIAPAVRRYVGHTDGWFKLTDIYNAMQLPLGKKRQAAYMALYRMWQDGDVVKHSTSEGVYRRRIRDWIKMDWLGATAETITVSYPLDFQEFFVTYPKNIILGAATPDGGKTAFAIDFIARNMYDFPIHYWTNEMDKSELKMRVLKRKDIEPGDWKFSAYECGRNYADAVSEFPNDVHIIDYLEVNDNFSQEIGDGIRAIHEALDTGIALVFLQKDYGAMYGRGRGFSTQRPRLYFTMEGGEAKIIKCKNRVDGTESYNGKTVGFKIIDGCNIIKVGEWHRGEDPFKEPAWKRGGKYYGK